MQAQLKEKEKRQAASGASVRGVILCVLSRNFNINACHFRARQKKISLCFVYLFN